MILIKTGIYLPEEKFDILKESMRVFGGIPIRYRRVEINRLAIENGLPKIIGFYGMSEDGEFVYVEM